MIQQIQEVTNIANIANTANKILVINEMVKNIGDEKLEVWNPVNIIIDAVGKDVVQKALLHHLETLKEELKKDITLL